MTSDRITVVGDDEAEARIRAAVMRFEDLRPFWPMVTRLFTSWMSRQFETSGAFAGRPWAPLSPAYAAWKSAHGGDKRPLVFSGGLLQAATRTKRTALPRSLTLTIPDDEWGHGPNKVKRPILQFHQEGTPKMPARPLVFSGSALPPGPAAELDDAAETYVRDILNRL